MSKKRKAPSCPKCGVLAVKQETRFGIRYAHCDVWAWGRHPLTDAATHKARSAAHAAFDPIWQRGIVSRSTAYVALAGALGIERSACHMKLMPAAIAARVPAIAAHLEREFLACPHDQAETIAA